MLQEIFRPKDAVEDFVRRLTEEEVGLGVSSLMEPQGGLCIDTDAEIVLKDNFRLALGPMIREPRIFHPMRVHQWISGLGEFGRQPKPLSLVVSSSSATNQLMSLWVQTSASMETRAFLASLFSSSLFHHLLPEWSFKPRRLGHGGLESSS